MAAVVVKTGSLAGRRITVEVEVTLGRETTDVVFADDGEISRRHAALRPARGRVEVEDLGSTNGTFVNDRRIDAPTPLSPGDSVRIGRTTIEVEATPGAGDTIVSEIPAEIRRRPVPAPAAPAPAAPAATHDDAPTASLPEKELRRRRATAAGSSARNWRPWLAALVLVVLAFAAYLLFFMGDDFASAADDACAPHASRVRELKLGNPRRGDSDLRRLHRIRAAALHDLRALERPDDAREYFAAFGQTQQAIRRLASAPKKGPIGPERGLATASRTERDRAEELELGSCARLTGL